MGITSVMPSFFYQTYAKHIVPQVHTRLALLRDYKPLLFETMLIL